MHGFRHYGWLYSRLIFFSLGLGLVCQQMALTQEPVSKTERANQLVDDALDAELQGLHSQRDRLLTEAIEVEKSLTALEDKEKIKGKIMVNNDEYHETRAKLIKIIC